VGTRATLSSDLWRSWLTERDERAFEALVRAEMPALHDAARRRGLGADEADDVVQEALVELARERSEKPARVGIGAWLMRVVLSRASNRRRSNARRARHEQVCANRSDLPAGPRQDVREEVDRAIEKLDEDERQIVLFRYVYDLEYREIAYVLGVSENACRIRAHRACSRLRSILGTHALALLAVLSLPEPAAAATQVSAAIAGAGSGSASAGFLGGILMTTAAKVGVSALASAALTVGVMSAVRPLPSQREGEAVVAEDVPVAAGGERPSTSPLLAAGLTAEEAQWAASALRQERERRRAATILPSDTGIAVAERVVEHGADAWPLLLGDFDTIAMHVHPAPGQVARFESTGALTKVDAYRPALPEGTEVIEFGPGTFRVSNLSRRRGADKGTGHLEIRGAGVDATTIHLDDSAVHSGARNEHVRIHDLTVDLGGRSLLVDEREGAAFLLERVHVKDWASGGHSAAIGIGGLAYLACRDCTFEMTRQEGMFAVSLRGPAVVAFDRCRFLGLRSVVGGQRSAQGSRVAIRDCVFEDSLLASSGVTFGPGRRTSIAIRVQGGVVSYGPPAWTAELRRERWGAALAEDVTGVSFTPTVRVMAPPDLAQLLRSVSLPSGEIIHRVEVTGWLHRAPSILRVDSWNPSAKETRVYDIRLSASGGWETHVGDRSGSSPPAGTLEAPDMADLLSRVRMPGGAGIRVAQFVTRPGLREGQPAQGLGLSLNTGEDPHSGRGDVWIDPATGRPFED
jgi:RNA polymerase sigma-70 factor (ECF subfamily)